MKILLLALIASSLFCLDVDSFLQKYPLPVYQDILIHNRVVAAGSNQCACRYELIKPLFESYDRPFTVLEIGAAQGYFSFRIAHDFPHSFCTMIEEDTFCYPFHGRMLEELCQLNSHLTNVSFRRTRLNLHRLQHLAAEEHFDVVLAFLVIHGMESLFQTQVALFQTLLQIADYLILEICDEAALKFSHYIQKVSLQPNCKYLGEVKRYADPNLSNTGRLYLYSAQPVEN